MADIADSANINEQEHEMAIEDEHEEQENSENSSTMNTSASFLTELNLLMILSCLSSSAEGCLDSEEVKVNQMDCDKDHQKAKSFALDLRKRTRETNEFRAVERTPARFQTKIKDCRHGRKM